MQNPNQQPKAVTGGSGETVYVPPPQNVVYYPPYSPQPPSVILAAPGYGAYPVGTPQPMVFTQQPMYVPIQYANGPYYAPNQGPMYMPVQGGAPSQPPPVSVEPLGPHNMEALIEGVLEKKTSIGYNLRYVRLVLASETEAMIYYFKQKHHKEPLGKILLSKIVNIKSEGPANFQIETKDKTFTFKASPDMKVKWMDLLSTLIKLKSSETSLYEIKKKSLVNYVPQSGGIPPIPVLAPVGQSPPIISNPPPSNPVIQTPAPLYPVLSQNQVPLDYPPTQSVPGSQPATTVAQTYPLIPKDKK